MYLLRHGIAERRTLVAGRADVDRPLTSDGADKMKRVALRLRKRGVSVDCILTSPLRRAQQSARIVARALRFKSDLVITPHLEPGGSLEALIQQLNSEFVKKRRILLVGHEPSLSSLISVLISGRTEASMVMKKGGLCRISVDTIRFGKCGTLEWLLPPSQVLAK